MSDRQTVRQTVRRTVRRSFARPFAVALAAAALTGGALAGGGAAPAGAATRTAYDGNDASIGADLHRARVTHEARLRVRIRFDDLYRQQRRQHLQGMNVYVDTRPARPGPELVMETALWRGGDRLIGRTGSSWAVGRRLDCFTALHVDWRRDVAVAIFGRDCLGAAGGARVAVTAYEGSGTYETDWLHARRSFTRWVARG